MRPLVATLATLLLLTPRAFAGEGETLAVCTQPSNDEQHAAVILSRWMRSARIEVSPCVPGSAPRRRLAFVPGPDGSVLVRLETGAAPREREVPWLERTDAPLSRLRAKSALARFSVIVEALLAEDRLAAPVTPVVVTPRPQPKPVPAVRKQPIKPTEPTEPAPHAASTPSDRVSTEPAPIAPPPPALPALPVASAPWPAPAPAPAPDTTSPSSASPNDKRWAFGIDGGASYHLRSPYLDTWEFGGGLHYGPIRFAITYQPEAVWRLDEQHPIGVNVLAFALGGRFALFEVEGFELGVLGSLLLDYLVVWRKDTLKAHDVTDFGVAGGVFSASSLGPAGAELRLEGIVMPTARQVEIPSGPSRRLNLFGLRVSLCLFWDIWRPT